MLSAHWRAAARHRARFRIPVVGITGSCGKTTTKDMLAAILQERGPVLKSPGNMNCPGPVRRTLLQMNRSHWAAVLEVASARRGYVARSAAMARPVIGIVTNVTLAHAVLLGGLRDIAWEKGALLRSLPKGGLALVNADDPGSRLLDLKRVKARVIRYGLSPTADIWASDIAAERGGTSFAVHRAEESAPLWIPAPGEHNVYNALAAYGAARALRMPIPFIQRGLSSFHRMGSRLQVKEMPNGITFVNDTYNANPLSMSAALTVLRDLPGSRKVAVLGRMGSLGRYVIPAHVHLGRQVAAAGLDEVVLVGSQARNVLRGIRAAGGRLRVTLAPDPDAAVDHVLRTVAPGSVVLFKASHSAKLGPAYRRAAAVLERPREESGAAVHPSLHLLSRSQAPATSSAAPAPRLQVKGE
ncbi:MAG: UDP-N-acetylmuramoyl-tripeptide--D-alanyl-D-alanine ligase [Bacillota bacterium]